MDSVLSPFAIACVVTTLGIAGCFLADRSSLKVAEWVGKPAASLAFVWLGVHTANGSEAPAVRAFLAALFLSLVGDLALMRKTNAAFLGGLGAFLLGHVAFVVAFILRGISLPFAIGMVPLVMLVAVPVSRWLLPHVDGPMRAPVIAYMTVISAMVVCAVGTYGHAPAPSIVVAALMFFVSDLAVARQQFVVKNVSNRLWGLPLYFGAQLIFAASVLR